MLFYDVQLAGIAVQGNTAVVHYYFTNERKDAEGKFKKRQRPDLRSFRRVKDLDSM